MERKEKNCENVEVKKSVLQNLLEKFKREKKYKKQKNKKTDRLGDQSRLKETQKMENLRDFINMELSLSFCNIRTVP